MEHYNRAYQFHINSVPSKEYWGDCEGYPCLPPPYKRPIGRPTKKRARHEFERQGNCQYKMPQKYGQTTCKWCKKVNTSLDNTSQAAETASRAANEQEDAADISDREQEMYYEETLEAADEQQVTQGHPQSQTNNEVSFNVNTFVLVFSATYTDFWNLCVKFVASPRVGIRPRSSICFNHHYQQVSSTKGCWCCSCCSKTSEEGCI
ncbi:hypothetical protein AHAS_Ahas15G0133700 [Arachis hypogaea]